MDGCGPRRPWLCGGGGLCVWVCCGGFGRGLTAGTRIYFSVCLKTLVTLRLDPSGDLVDVDIVIQGPGKLGTRNTHQKLVSGRSTTYYSSTIIRYTRVLALPLVGYSSVSRAPAAP